MTAPWRFLPCGTCCEPLTCEGHLCLWTDATAVTVTQGTLVSGTFTSLYSHSAGYVEVQPGGAGLDCYVSFQLGTSYAPVGVRVAGHYEAEAGKSIDVDLYDFDAAAWVNVGSWDHAVADILPWPEYSLGAQYVSPTGEVRIRWQTADTDAAYRLYLDVTRACHDREPFDQVEVTINFPEFPGLEGVYILDWAGYLWVYEFPEPLPYGIITSIELHPIYGSWLEPWNINGMFMWCRIKTSGGSFLVRWWGYVYPPADCDFDELTLPYLYGAPWPPTAGRPVVSAVH